MFKSFKLCCTTLTILCSHIMLLDRASSETLTDNGENLNIIKVLNTSEILWLYWQTTENAFTVSFDNFTILENESCTHTRMISISQTQYNFTQTTIMKGKAKGESTRPERLELNYTGEFVNDTQPPKSMKVFFAEAPTTPLEQMTLQYTDDLTSACSVFFIFSLDNGITNNMGTCEMYVRDSEVDNGPSVSCQTFFKQRCNSTMIYKPYSASCKKEDAIIKATEGNDIGSSETA